MSTETYLTLVKARIEARAQLASFGEQEYQAARNLYRSSRSDYARAQPHYATDPDLGRLYEVPDLNELANSACGDLLTCLAAVRRMARQRAPSPRLVSGIRSASLGPANNSEAKPGTGPSTPDGTKWNGTKVERNRLAHGGVPQNRRPSRSGCSSSSTRWTTS